MQPVLHAKHSVAWTLINSNNAEIRIKERSLQIISCYWQVGSLVIVGLVVVVKGGGGVAVAARYKLPLIVSYSCVQNKLNLSVLNSHFDISCTKALSHRKTFFVPSRLITCRSSIWPLLRCSRCKSVLNFLFKRAVDFLFNNLFLTLTNGNLALSFR